MGDQGIQSPFVISTERLSLRPYTDADIDPLSKIFGDAETIEIRVIETN